MAAPITPNEKPAVVIDHGGLILVLLMTSSPAPGKDRYHELHQHAARRNR